jgi:hypothetical protein
MAVLIRLLTWVIWPARSSSKPHNIASSATRLLANFAERSVCGSLSEDICVTGLGFGFISKQSAMPHNKPRQVCHQHTPGARYRDRERADCGRLIYNQQSRTVLFKLADQRSQFRFVVVQDAVQKTFSLAVQCDAMMCSFAYVETTMT